MGLLDALGEVVSAPVHAVERALPHVAEAATSAGHFVWEHKNEIGMVVGTAALLASIPMTGGASGAAVGGLAAGRIALGATQLGGMAIAAQMPLAAVGTALAGAALVDDGIKLAHGEGSIGRVALDALGLLPGVGMLGKAVAARRALGAEVSAARAVARTLPAVQTEARVALAQVEDLAHTPATRVLGTAVNAADDAVGQAARTLRPGDDIARISDLKSKVDTVARSARVARSEAAAAGQLDRTVATNLDRMTRQATKVSKTLEHQALRHSQITRTYQHADALQRTAGRAATTSGIVTNGAGVARASGQQKQGTDLSLPNLVRGVASLFLSANAGRVR